MIVAARAQRMSDVVAQWLGKAGQSRRHAAEFSRPFGQWSESTKRAFAGILEAAGHAAPGNASMLGQFATVLPASTVFMPDFTSFQAELNNVNEVLRYTLYSAKAYATTGHLTLSFFDQNEGTATQGRADTNMQIPGQLPANNMLLMTALRIAYFPPFADFGTANTLGVAAPETIRLLTNNVWIEGYISQKLYQIGAPATLYPYGAGPGTFVASGAVGATTNQLSYVNNGLPSNEAVYRQNPPLGILPGRAFQWQYRSNTLNTVTSAGRMMFHLDGMLLRAAQ